MASFDDFCGGLLAAGVRFVVIGVSGANFYAGSNLFMTRDQDLLLPRDSANLLAAWRVAEQQGLQLRSGAEPLDVPRDEALAKGVSQRSALVSDGGALWIDLTLVMAGFDFDTVYAAHRKFRLGGVEIPVARLSHIVASKAQAGRPKDRLFLATHAEALRKLLAGDASQ